MNIINKQTQRTRSLSSGPLNKIPVNLLKPYPFKALQVLQRNKLNIVRRVVLTQFRDHLFLVLLRGVYDELELRIPIASCNDYQSDHLESDVVANG